MKRLVVLLVLVAQGCHASSRAPATPAETPAPEESPAPEPTPDPLQVRFLGVGGFELKVGDDAVLTAPLFTNPSMLDVTVGEIASRHDLVDAFLGDVSATKVILSGHAHYDHLMDVPYAWTKTPGATIYGNLSAKRLLAGFAPDPSPGCDAVPADAPWARVPRENVVALDDPADDAVDWRMCGGTGAGRWVHAAGGRVRIRALCSAHPDQVLFVHFGEGHVEADACVPPAKAPDWKEGTTLAFLVDFLDETGAPLWRVYYQDAPYDAPVSHPHASLLAEKSVDLAIVNGGNYEQVDDHPQGILAALQPGHALLGHWEDFFRTREEPVQPIPFLDVALLESRMEEAMPGRWTRPQPGEAFRFDQGIGTR